MKKGTYKKLDANVLSSVNGGRDFWKDFFYTAANIEGQALSAQGRAEKQRGKQILGRQ